MHFALALALTYPNHCPTSCRINNRERISLYELVMFIAMHFTLTHPSELRSSFSITFISTLPLVHTRPSHHTLMSHYTTYLCSHMHIHTKCAMFSHAHIHQMCYVLTCTYTPRKHTLSHAHTHHMCICYHMHIHTTYTYVLACTYTLTSDDSEPQGRGHFANFTSVSNEVPQDTQRSSGSCATL